MLCYSKTILHVVNERGQGLLLNRLTVDGKDGRWQGQEQAENQHHKYRVCPDDAGLWRSPCPEDTRYKLSRFSIIAFQLPRHGLCIAKKYLCNTIGICPLKTVGELGMRRAEEIRSLEVENERKQCGVAWFESRFVPYNLGPVLDHGRTRPPLCITLRHINYLTLLARTQ